MSYRPSYVFSIRDGVVRAWTVAQLDGKIVLVSTPFEAAKSQITKGEADEAPPGTILDVSTYGRQVPMVSVVTGDPSAAGCGCGGKGKAEIDVVVVGAQKTEVAFAGRGRLVSGSAAVGEPLFAVAEGTENRVACCGGACENAGTPAVLAFDTYVPIEGGGYTIKSSHEAPLPQKLTDAYARRSPACLPWVRVERDPERFRSCLAQARALGPIKDSRDVCKLVGKYMLEQDQEVFLVILLDVQLQVRGISEVARGARDRVDVPVPDVLRIAVVEGSSGFIVVHNHPSGIPKPSESDEELTKTLKDASKQVHLELIDHVIIAGDKSYSFAKHGNILKRAK